MARNGSGTYSLPVNSFNPAVNGVSATAADWQTLINDVATALTGSLAADGQTPMSGNLAMGANKITGLANATLSTDAIALGQLTASSGASVVNYLPAQSGASAISVQTALRMNFNPGNATAVAGGAMQIDALMEAGTPTFPLKNEGGIWVDKVHVFAGVSKEFTASTGASALDMAPAAAFFAYAVNNGSLSDVCALIADSVVNTAGSHGFGANIIVRNASGVNGCKMVGMEIDVEYAAGTTSSASGSGGLFINVFSAAVAGAAIQIGGIASGTFANGIALTGGLASNASGLFSNGLSIGSLVNTGTSTYADGAIVVSNTHKVVFSGTAANPGSMYMDGANALLITGGAVATVFRNQANTASLMTIANGGVITLGSTATFNWDAALASTTIGAAGGASALPATPLGYIAVQVAGATRKIPYYNA